MSGGYFRRLSTLLGVACFEPVRHQRTHCSNSGVNARPVAETGLKIDIETIDFDSDRLQAGLGLRWADQSFGQRPVLGFGRSVRRFLALISRPGMEKTTSSQSKDWIGVLCAVSGVWISHRSQSMKKIVDQ
ncbi:hypothetical protein MMC29_006453 [Sticta canariensis]|nr:hypothetical protein [Sticta canariensis]